MEIQEKYGLSSPSNHDGVVNPDPRQNHTGPSSEGESLSASSPSRTLSQSITSTPQEFQPPPFPWYAQLLKLSRIPILARTVRRFLLGRLAIPSWAKHRNSLQPDSIWHPDSGLSEKVREACRIARADGYRYIWVDSSCIDKTSSSELSEAINSMFNWYRGAQVCYAFLADVPSDDNIRHNRSKFRESRWFRRAWTLQELIAPRVVVFFSKHWEPLGTKDTLADLVEDITHIDHKILTHKKALAEESVAERMRWAEGRRATRVEDEAYSLLGIFGITMPTLYGEDRHAFQRLQEEILQRIPDHSLFAWSCGDSDISRLETDYRIIAYPRETFSLFASSPSPLGSSWPSGRIISLSHKDFEFLGLPLEEFTPTPHGIRTQMTFIPMKTLCPNLSIVDPNDRALDWHILLLAIIERAPDDKCLLGKLCSLSRMRTNVDSESPTVYDTVRSGLNQSTTSFQTIFTIPLNGSGARKLLVKTVYLPRPEPVTATRELELDSRSGREDHELSLFLPTWARAVLRQQEYTLHEDPCQPRTEASPYYSKSVTLSNTSQSSFGIHIQYRFMLSGSTMAIEALIWILPPDSGQEVQNHLIQRIAPYTSAIWTDKKQLFIGVWNITLPTRSIHLVADSGDEVTLRLGLGLVAPSRYHLYIMIDPTRSEPDAPNSTSELSTRAASVLGEDCVEVIQWMKEGTELKFTMLGSVRQALEREGYSIHLEGSGTHMCRLWHSLPLSNNDLPFTIYLEHFYAIRRHGGLVVAACVTLQSSPDPSDGSEPHQDGPYVVVWGESSNHNLARPNAPKWTHEHRRIGLTTSAGNFLTLRLGLDLAWQSEYYLLVDIEHEGLSLHGEHQPDGRHEQGRDCILDGFFHSNITLTLPGHVKRSLREQGYHVEFSVVNAHEDHPDRYVLTLSDANLTIAIEYTPLISQPIDEYGNQEQRLTFRTCAKVLSLCRVRDDTTSATHDQDVGQTMEWEEGKLWLRKRFFDRSGCQWHWILPQKDVRLTTPTGLELTLRLGFYLVWLGQYCVTVELNPRFPLLRPEFPDTVQLETSDSGWDGIKEINDDGNGQGIITGIDKPDDQKAAHADVVALELEALPFWGVEDGEVWGKGDHGKLPATLIMDEV
ncbi:hypothetical protein GSI_08859 [Ganoderma sinense ZZ0214-1]|uniref:Uncharacterized protein n=1 Tax=Ganoderma sinense ZZ0214-1 TaxID=1077348 RepID=A0A2G8S508_9APHY|nr:hypothetical protein GSI_08859 [Ganoderma sinense ZZ0214-1]